MLLYKKIYFGFYGDKMRQKKVSDELNDTFEDMLNNY